MIAMKLTCPDLSPRQAPGVHRRGRTRGRTVTAPFQPLDPWIVNEAIPAFFIGRNREGFWVARDVNGRIGGIFLLENSALSFARRNSRPPAAARRSIRPRGSNSTWKTAAIRLSRRWLGDAPGEAARRASHVPTVMAATVKSRRAPP